MPIADVELRFVTGREVSRNQQCMHHAQAPDLDAIASLSRLGPPTLRGHGFRKKECRWLATRHAVENKFSRLSAWFSAHRLSAVAMLPGITKEPHR
jgi:hypothetical protein